MDFQGGRKSRFQWWDLGGVLCMYYLATNKSFKVETALLQFLSNLSHSFTGLYLMKIINGKVSAFKFPARRHLGFHDVTALSLLLES